MYVVVVGGGSIGFQLTKRLLQEGHEVTLLEKDKKRTYWLTDQLGDVVVQGDGCEVRVLREVGASRADVFAALTGDDEDNLVSCQIAKLYFNVKRTVARVTDSRHAGLFQRLGVDSPISSTQLVFNVIDQQIESTGIIPIGALQKGNLEVVETMVAPKASAIGKKVRDLQLPVKSKSLIVCIVRGEQALLVTGDTIIQEEDIVLALVHTSEQDALQKALSEPIEYLP